MRRRVVPWLEISACWVGQVGNFYGRWLNILKKIYKNEIQVCFMWITKLSSHYQNIKPRLFSWFESHCWAGNEKHLILMIGVGVCVCSILILMWYAAGSESSVVPHVLKTILLILKGKPREMEKIITERKLFSLDTTNMMPVAVNNTMINFYLLSLFS